MDTDTTLRLEPDPANKQGAEEKMEETKTPNGIIHSEKRFLFSFTRLHAGFLSVLILLLLVLLAVCSRPAIYYENLIQSGDMTYPVKTNRITGGKRYYYENTWHKNPMPVAKPYKSPITVAIDSPSPEKKEPKDTFVSLEETVNVGVYAIQVKAFQDFKDVNELSDSLKKRGFNVAWRKVKITNKGVWYRVFIGRFTDVSKAAQYMKENDIESSFPGSFIRKLSMKSEQP